MSKHCSPVVIKFLFLFNSQKKLSNLGEAPRFFFLSRGVTLTTRTDIVCEIDNNLCVVREFAFKKYAIFIKKFFFVSDRLTQTYNV